MILKMIGWPGCVFSDVSIGKSKIIVVSKALGKAEKEHFLTNLFVYYTFRKRRIARVQLYWKTAAVSVHYTLPVEVSY